MMYLLIRSIDARFSLNDVPFRRRPRREMKYRFAARSVRARLLSEFSHVYTATTTIFPSTNGGGFCFFFLPLRVRVFFFFYIFRQVVYVRLPEAYVYVSFAAELPPSLQRYLHIATQRNVCRVLWYGGFERAHRRCLRCATTVRLL